MRLAKVTISGFKSFADTTEFRFDQPITGIVGPNGCGKSNVVDAIKWVLGERSAKSLRGDAMMDVDLRRLRRPQARWAWRASRSTFDNPVLASAVRRAGAKPPAGLLRGRPIVEAITKTAGAPTGPRIGPHRIRPTQSPSRLLPIDTDQVSVTRRLYRDGASEYLINDQKCRLRDIKELLPGHRHRHRTPTRSSSRAGWTRCSWPTRSSAAPFSKRRPASPSSRPARSKPSANSNAARSTSCRVREDLANTERRLRIVKGQAVEGPAVPRTRSRGIASCGLTCAGHLSRIARATGRPDQPDHRTGSQACRHGRDAAHSSKTTSSRPRSPGTNCRCSSATCSSSAWNSPAAASMPSSGARLTERNIAEARPHIDEDRTRLAELTERLRTLTAD